MTILFLEFIISLLLMFIGTQLLVNSSVSISNHLNIPKLIIGLTVVSLATSLPEFFVTFQSTLKGLNEFAIGNVVGSNISNIALVLGLTALIKPVVLSKKEFKLNYIPLLLISVGFVIILFTSSSLGKFYAVGSIISLIIFNVFLFKKGQGLVLEDDFDDKNIFTFLKWQIHIKSLLVLFFILLIGTFIMWISSEILIESAKEVAKLFGVSDRVIAISLVAIGTSLPELFTSLYSIYNGETKLALGNLLGSNVFNILAVLGFTSLISDIEITTSLKSIIINGQSLLGTLHGDVIIMLIFTILLLPLFYFFNIQRFNIFKNKNTEVQKNMDEMRIVPSEGLILLLLYTGYLIVLFIQ